jgi:hypothetical protein
MTGAPGKRLRVNIATACARTVEEITVKSRVSSLMPTFFAAARNPCGCGCMTGDSWFIADASSLHVSFSSLPFRETGERPTSLTPTFSQRERERKADSFKGFG